MSWEEIASELPGGQSTGSCQARYYKLLAHHRKLLLAELGGEGGDDGTSSYTYSYNNSNNNKLTPNTKLK